MKLDGLTPEEAAVYEWQYGYCGDFKKALWEVIMAADESNLDKLELGFPVEVIAYKLYAFKSGWWQEVVKKVQALGYQIKP